jgi:type III secretion protein R
VSGSGVSTLLTVAVLSAVPLLFLATTSYAKIAVVLGALKSAFGGTDIPGGGVVAALAILLSLYVMAPVGAAMAAAAGPELEDLDPTAPFEDLPALGRAALAGAEPLRAFLARNAGERERRTFFELAQEAAGDGAAAASSDRDLAVVLPAFLLTELAEAFQLAFLILLPFLVVDLVITNLLLSLGAQALDPRTVSLPFKLLLFVMADGWLLLSRALVSGYG